MRESRITRMLSSGFLGLAAGAALATAAGAVQPATPSASPGSAAAVVRNWESAEQRLTILIGEVPLPARKGIERALSANREGRRNAEAALTRGDEPRALRALEIASAHAEIGFNQARAVAPERVLPALEAAATEMNQRQPATISGLVAAPSVDVRQR